MGALPLPAAILWSDLGATLVHESGAGSDILGGAVKRDDTAGDTLYFKFHIDPLSDVSTEEYAAGFQLFDGDTERLAVGNALKAWAYSVYNAAQTGPSNRVFGDFDLQSMRPESVAPRVFLPYELPRRGIENTIVFKVQFVPGTEDRVTVWLNPDLAAGATEAGQPAGLTTAFTADATFDQIRLRHAGGGGGWTFSDMAIATAFDDFVSSGTEMEGDVNLGRRGAVPYTFRSWQREQGLPQNSVRALAQTRDGYIWIGSDDGVARFDGVRFVSYGLREGLRSSRVRVLCADSHGALWIGTVGGGLTLWQDGKFTTYTTQNGLPADTITALAEDDDGLLWVGTEAGLAVCGDGRVSAVPSAKALKGRPITALFKDRRGAMWVGATGAGVFQFSGGKLLPLAESSVEGLLQDPHCLLVDRVGRLWIGAGDDYVLCRDGSQWHRYRIPRHLARPYVSALAEAPDGTVWAGSVSEGLFEFRDGKLKAINASSGLSDNLVASLLVDHEGKLWVGTGAGLNRLRTRKLSAFGQNEGLGYGAVQGLAEIAPGVIWAGKPGDGVFRSEGRGFNRLNAPGLTRPYPQVNALLMTQDGSCWLAGAEGLLRFADPRQPDSAVASALPGRNFTALAEDQHGSLWAGTRDGAIWQLHDGHWTARTNLAQAHAITSIVPAPDGTLWVGTEGSGVAQFQGETRLRLEKTNGLLSDLIRTLYLDVQGTLWIGTAGGGLSRWRDRKVATFTTREGLPDNTISQILEDDSGRLWLGGNRGIAAVSKAELDELAAGKIPAVYPQIYGRAEGMLSEECTGGFHPAGLKTKSGLLYFPTLKGVVVADPRPQHSDVPAPPVLIEEIAVDGEVQTFSGPAPGVETSAEVRPASPKSQPPGLRVAPGKRRFEFHYTGLSFDAPERVRFRYRLEGLDPDWVEAGTRRTAFYSYVPPGNYLFRVIAGNSDGTWHAVGASVPLTVLPHFWQVWWFIALAALILLGSVGGVVRLMEKRKHQSRLRQLEQDRALERERARIAQDLHDDLGSSLARISLLSGLARADKGNPRQVEAHVNKIAQSADETVRALEEIVWAVRPGSDSLQSLVEYIAHFANELFEGNGPRCRLDLPHDLPARPLPPEVRHNLFLIVKEALTNVLKHGDAREVRVQAKADADKLEILIQDDGRGFTPASAAATEKGNGLGNMQRRAAALGGVLTVTSRPGKGTTVRLTVNFPPDREAGRA